MSFFSKIAISRRLPPTKPLSGKSIWQIWDLVEFILLVLSSLEWIPFITGHSFNPSFPPKGQQAQRKPFYIFQLWNFTPPPHELANRGGPPFAKLWQQKTPSRLRGQGTGSLNSGDSWICNQRSGTRLTCKHNIWVTSKHSDFGSLPNTF